MKIPFLTALGALLLLTRAPGTILLNEVHINVPDPASTGSDSNFEFIELRSTTNGVESCDGLTLLLIDNNGGQVGEVKEAWNLTGLSTGPNGLIMIGDDYDKDPKGGPWTGFKDQATVAADPSGAAPYSSMGSDDIGPNGGLTVLLVSGWTGMSNATPTSLGDVDVGNIGNSILDWNRNPKPGGSQVTQPYAALIDSVGFRDLTNSPVRLPYCPATADLSIRATSAPNFPPDSIARRLSRATPAWANSSAAWYGGNIAGTARDSVAYDIQFFGDFKGQATPGKPNLDAAPVTPNFLLNEVSINPAGSADGNNEYVEIINTVANAGAFSASLQGYTLVLLGSNDGDGGASVGKILEAWDLNSFSTGANGLLLIGNDYPSGFSPWGRFLDPATQLADPEAPPPPVPPNPVRLSAFGAGDLGDNNGFTLLLVRNYAGSIGQDLDTNNDGILDVAPWLLVQDSIGFDQAGGGTGKTYAIAKIVTAPLYDPDLVSRKLGNTTANSAAAWYGGDYGGNSPASIALKNEAAHPVFGGFKGAATPGQANLAAASPAGDIRLNEVQINPVVSPDGSAEYIELLSTNFGIAGMNDLTLVIARADAGADNGKILESIDLSALSTGGNGLIIIGDSYDNFSPYDAPQKLISPLTNREDPPGFDANDIGPNSALAILLVKGPKPAVDSSVAAIAADNIVDSIATAAVGNSTVAVLTTPFIPDNVSREPTALAPNSPAAWFSGQLDPAGGDSSITYGNSHAGNYKGGASPGRYNHAATPNPAASLVINEINLNPPGGDNNKEFIEYRSSTSQAISANGYTLLLLDVDGASTGTVLEAWSLDGLATGTSGLLLTGSGYTLGVPWTGSSAPSPGTVLGSPAGLDPDDIGGATDNGATTLLLVRYFSGKVGDDLDGGAVGGIGADDGTLDTTPWNALVDAAGVMFWDVNKVPAPGLVGRVYGGVDLSRTGYTPDNLSRYRDKLDVLSAAAWYGADIAGAAGTSVAFDPIQKFPAAPFIGRVTPGQPNLPTLASDAADDDGDGASNLVEEALGMNPGVPDAGKLPAVGLVDVGGVLYPGFSFNRFTGGTPVGTNGYSYGGLLYTVQFSTNLLTWNNNAELVNAGSSSGSPPFELATYRPTATAFADGQTAGQMFLRLKVSRQ